MTTTETVTQYNVRKPDGTLFLPEWTDQMINANFQATFLSSNLAQLGAVGEQIVMLVQRTVVMEIGEETVVVPEVLPEWSQPPAPVEDTLTEDETDELLADEPAPSDDFDTPQAN